MKRFSYLAAAFALSTLAACAGDVTDVDRTQPNRVDKAIFKDSEWFFVPTVVEAQFNQGFVFEGLQGGGDRVRWEIRESELIAYRSYQTLENQESNNGVSGGSFKGVPVARFAIESHFDVKRQYNPSTGDQNNVIVENTVDRPWWERDYMRVDWSANLMGDQLALTDFMSFYSGAPYYVQPHEIDNPHRAEITGNAINVVQHYNMVPDEETCYGYFRDWNCAPAQVKMKLSFMKVGNRDYEPLYYPDRLSIYDDEGNQLRDCDGDDDGEPDGECQTIGIPMFERFGFFRTERQAYDKEFGQTRDGRIFLANRWNIWKNTYGTNGQPLPMASRQPGSFTYYTNADFPTDQELWDASTSLVGQWDDVFRETIAEHKRTIAPQITKAQIPTVFQLKKNTCTIENASSYAQANGYTDDLKRYGIAQIQRGNLKRACSVLEAVSANKKEGERFVWQKPGDIRYSYLHWVDGPAIAGPLGYGPSVADPITGEIIAGYANIYGAALETYAAQAADYVAVLNGELDIETVSSGEWARDQIEEHRGFGANSRSFAGDFSEAKMAQMSQRFDRMRAEAQAYAPKSPEGARRAFETGALTLKGRVSPQAREFATATANAKLNRIAGSRFEREMLLSDELKRGLLGPEKYNPSAGLDESEGFSPLKLETSDKMKRHAAMLKVQKHACYLSAEEFGDSGLFAVAKELQGLPWEEVYRRARAMIYEGIMAHEVGHTLGLRHNFEGSYDALNFHPGFWEHYNPTTGKVERGTQANPTGADKYMYSTIMDYMPRPYDDIAGIGMYDRAAIKFGYGKLVEMFNENTASLYFSDLAWFNDYSDLPKLVAGKNVCTTAANCHPDFMEANDHYSAYVDAVNAGNADVARVEYELYNRWVVSYLKNATNGITVTDASGISARRNVSFDELYELWRGYYLNNETEVFNYDEVPYKFCPDEYTYESNVTCQPWDKGANFNEIINDRWERYAPYYMFSAFKRDRFTFTDDINYLWSYQENLRSRFFGPMSSVYRYYLYGFSGIGYDGQGNYLTLNDFPAGKDWQKAGINGLNYLSTIIHQPEPGTYCKTGTVGNEVYEPLAEGQTCPAADMLEVPAGVGRYYNTDWTEDYFYKPTRIGAFWDKYAALMALTDNEGFFYRNFADYLDSGAFSLSYWRGLSTEMLDLFGSAYSGDTGSFAWRFDPAQSGVDRFTPRPVVDIYETPVPASLPAIKPASSWTLRYYMVVMPMGRFNSMYDYTEDFGDFARVCLEGYQDCMDFAGVTEKFIDPLTQLTYIAPETAGDGSVDNLGARLLADANDYVTTVYNPAKSAYDAMRANPDTFAYTAAEQTQVNNGMTRADIRFQREVALGRAERGINERSAFLDVIRDVAQMTEFN